MKDRKPRGGASCYSAVMHGWYLVMEGKVVEAQGLSLSLSVSLSLSLSVSVCLRLSLSVSVSNKTLRRKLGARQKLLTTRQKRHQQSESKNPLGRN